MTPIGFRLYYGDGTVRSSRDGAWAALPSDNVQVVVIIMAETYQEWTQDGWDSSGNPINRRLVTRNHTLELHPHVEPRRTVDFFWFDARTGSYDCGATQAVPSGLPNGAAKRYKAITRASFRPIYAAAHLDTSLP